MGKICQPLNVTEGIALVNDMIVEGTQMQEALKEFQSTRRLSSDLFELGKAGRGWWNGFMKRHGHRLVTKKGERFACDRSYWTTLANIQQMYDVIYDAMVDASIAMKIQVPVFTDRYGNEVSEKERFGLEQHIKLTKPAYLLFPDETGCNTSKKKRWECRWNKVHCGEGNCAPVNGIHYIP